MAATGTVGVAPGTSTLVLPDGSVIELADWIDDRYFGTVQLNNGQNTPVDAFSAGRSQQIPNGTRTMTKVDTNIPRPGPNGLPQAYAMLVYTLAVKAVRAMRPPTGIAQPVLADGAGALSNPLRLQTLFSIDRVCSLQFEYRDKIYSQGVMQNYPQGHGFYVFATTSDFEIAQNGVPSPRDRWSMVLPIHIEENLGYKMTIQPEATLVVNQVPSDASATNLTFVDLKVEMVGLIKRPVV
jgi:hypothetical protein